jgi:pilus assembly protein CpaC
VPTSQQVLLKVRIAELNRTAFRQIGANVLAATSKYGKNGAIIGTQLSNPVTGLASTDVLQPQQGTRLTPSKFFVGQAASAINSSNTLFGIFQNSNFEVLLSALRKNSLLKILAEPDLVAYNGHRASFLAGGEFPIPVPQIGATGVASTITVNFKKFGVQLDFLPVILDGDSIRLTVDPEVSSIDTSLGTTLVAGGSPVPGLNTRNAHTTVELRQGQTLAIAGLMQLSLDGQTTRIPGLGDLPVLGPFFSNTTSNRVEKELVVLVTPYLVEPMEHDQVPPTPGDEVGAPNDLEFYLLNRIEGRTGRDFRATTDGADPLRIGKLIHLERRNIRGPYGFSE